MRRFAHTGPGDPSGMLRRLAAPLAAALALPVPAAAGAAGGDLTGHRSGVDWLKATGGTAIAAGPTGSDVTFDGGRTWTPFDDAAPDAVDCVRGARRAGGPAGAVAVLGR